MRVLVVEDEPLLLMTASDTLTDLGHEVVGMATDLQAALQAARSAAIDLAILDVNLGGDRTDEVAKVLAHRGIPFLFATGYGAAALPAAFASMPYVGKPFDPVQLGGAIRLACADGGSKFRQQS